MRELTRKNMSFFAKINGSQSSSFKLSLILMIGLFSACQTDTQSIQDPYPRSVTSAFLSTHEQAIQGGQIDEGRKNVVGLVIQQNYGIGACSGSLIAPNLVLTAQHCISSVSTNGILCGISRFSPVYNPGSIFVTTETAFPRYGFYEVQEVLVPVAQGDVCGNDIALLILRTSVYPSVTDILVPRLDEQIEAGELFTAVGYGHTGNGDGSGVRRSIENRSVICSGYLNGCQEGNQGIYENEWVGNDGTCEGDSGGPALDDRGQVIGVLSRGAEGCLYPVYSDVVGHKDWIREQARRAKELGGYPLPSWVDGVAGEPPLDTDLDGIADRYDNCDDQSNPTQQDLDGDGIGDLCDDLISRDRGGRCPVCNACEVDDECGGDGAICLQLQTGGVCTYPCQGSYECPDSTECIRVSYDANEKYCFNENAYTDGACPEAFQCGGPRSSVTRSADDGACHVCDACERAEDCASGFCAQINDQKFCSRVCEENSDCRGNSRCAEMDGMKLCLNADLAQQGLCYPEYQCTETSNAPEAGTQNIGMDVMAGATVVEEGGVDTMAGAMFTENVGSENIGSEKSVNSDDAGCQGTQGRIHFLGILWMIFAVSLRRRMHA